MTWTFGVSVPANLSFIDDDVSRRKIALSATLTSCSFLTTLLTRSSLVITSIALEAEANRTQVKPTKTRLRSCGLRLMIGSMFVTQNAYPREALLEALLRFLEEDLGTP